MVFLIVISLELQSHYFSRVQKECPRVLLRGYSVYMGASNVYRVGRIMPSWLLTIFGSVRTMQNAEHEPFLAGRYAESSASVRD
jgi:hypothetical protein